MFSGHLSEGRGWLERVRVADPSVPDSVRAKAFFGASMIASNQGDATSGANLATECRKICSLAGDLLGTGQALLALSLAASFAGETRTARDHAEQALDLFRTAGHQGWLPWALNRLGLAASDLGDSERALSLYEEARLMFRQRSQFTALSIVLGNMAQVMARQGEDRRTLELIGEALRFSGDRGLFLGTVDVLVGLLDLTVNNTEPRRAARLLGAANRARTSAGLVHNMETHALYNRATERLISVLGAEAFMAEWTTGQSLSMGQVIAEARAIHGDLPDAIDLQIESNTPPLVASPQTIPSRRGDRLTEREVEVVRLLVAGQTDRQIAESLFISHATARTHVNRILQKLHVNSRAAAVAYAFQHGLV